MGKIKGKLTWQRVSFSLLAMVLVSLMAFACQPFSVIPSLVNFPGTMYQNSTNIFLARVDMSYEIKSTPIQDLKLNIYDSNGDRVGWVKFDFWGNIIGGSDHFTNIIPYPPRNTGWGWGYGEGTREYTSAWGYGYQPHYVCEYDPQSGGWLCGTENVIYGDPGPDDDWGIFYPPGWDGQGDPYLNWWQYRNVMKYGYGYFFHSWGSMYGYGYGYGFGYDYLPEPQWQVTFGTLGLPVGDYTARFSVDVPPEPKQFVSEDYPFTIVARAPSGGGGGYRCTEPITKTGKFYVCCVDSEGTALVRLCIISPDGKLMLCIPEGTRIIAPDGEGWPEYIEIVVLSTPPPPEGYQMVGPAYDLLVDGISFEEFAEMTIEYSEANIPAGVDEDDLLIAYYNGEKWLFLPTDVDSADNTAFAEVEHFTAFALFAELPVEDEAPPPAPPAPPAPPEEPTPAPAPTPTPTPTPTPEQEVPAGANWWLIGGIVIGVIVLGGIVFWVVRRRAA